MARLADLLEEKKELLATIDAWDNGRLLGARSAVYDEGSTNMTPRKIVHGSPGDGSHRGRGRVPILLGLG